MEEKNACGNHIGVWLNFVGKLTFTPKSLVAPKSLPQHKWLDYPQFLTPKIDRTQ